jgi:hypothetical protein
MTAAAPSSPKLILQTSLDALQKEPRMKIIGCDFHPSFQQVCFVDTSTGETGEQRLSHPDQARAFYIGLRGQEVRVGVESMGNLGWFQRLLRETAFVDKRPTDATPHSFFVS